MAKSPDPTLIQLAPAFIRTDGGTQPRAGLSEETVEQYVDAMRGGAVFPPIQCMYDGTDYWLWDGFHTLEARKRIGYSMAHVMVTQGTQADAVWMSYSANATHGLPRTKEETIRAIESALLHPRSHNLGHEHLAAHLHVSPDQIRLVRKRLDGPRTTATSRIGKDGKTYRVPAPRPRPTTEAKLKEVRVMVQEEPETVAPAKEQPPTDRIHRLIDKSDYFNLVTARDAMSAVRQRLIEAKSTWEAITKAIDTNPDAARFAKHAAYKTVLKIVSTFQAAILDLGKAEPWTSCPYCKGEGACEVCNGSRFVTEQQFDDCPLEVQKIAGPTFEQYRAAKEVAA